MADQNRRTNRRASRDTPRIDEESDYLSDDSDERPGVKFIPGARGPRNEEMRRANLYDSAVTMGHNNANSDIIQAEVIHAELVQDIDARLKQQLKEKEDQLMRGFAKREAQLNAKEAELKSREAQNIRHASSTVTSYPASVTPSGASCDSSQSWIDFLSSPCFEKDEIRIGKNLVTGTFNAVFELKSIKLQPQATWCSHDERSHNRKLLADSSKKQKIVCKRLKPSLDPKKQRLAGKRLVYEARLLSKLGHENVISMIGLSAPEAPDADFFFLMHQIQETLYHCISKTWNKRQRGKPKFILNQVTVATYIAAAIDYIHSLNIIFSDLKPENIGYNQAGVLKLFNFSKAQSLSKKHSTNKPHDTSLFTKAVYHGTRPYAAPEIAVKLPCNISVDTYAYAIVLWEIMSLKLCFGREMKASTFSTILEDVYDEKVEKRNQRPKFEKDTPKALQDIIKHCWSTDPKNRPSMKAVHSDLINYRDQLKMIM